ncbi:MAG: replication-relaxation family protein [Patescibacteria group bacterium]
MTKPTQSGSAPDRPGRKGTFPALELRERDRRILELVYEHRFLDVELLLRLLKVEPEPEGEPSVGADGKRRPQRYGFGSSALYKRLQLLSNAHYLEPHRPGDLLYGRGHGSPRTVYGLGPKSAGEVSVLAGISKEEVRRIVEANRVKGPFLRHALEVATVRVILELACDRSAGRVRLLFWKQGQILQDWVTGRDDDGEEQTYSVCPDAFFGLEVAGKGRAHYFLEIDRGTMPIVAKGRRSDIRKKVLGYYLYRRTQRHGQRYQYHRLPDGTLGGLHIALDDQQPLSQPEQGLEPIKSFTVLLVAPGATRGVAHARGRAANILSALPTFGKQFSSSTLFWFSSLDSFDIDRPDSVFAPVWLTVHPEKSHRSLIE